MYNFGVSIGFSIPIPFYVGAVALSTEFYDDYLPLMMKSGLSLQIILKVLSRLRLTFSLELNMSVRIKRLSKLSNS